MNLTCFYCQTPFTLSMDQKIAALRKMHAENLHHYDAHCPRCGRANAISRERLEMFTPGWEEAIKEPAAGTPAQQAPNTTVPAPASTPPAMEQETAMPMKKSAPTRRRHAPAAKKAAKKAPAKKAPAKKAAAKKKTPAKPKKKAATKAKSKSSSRKTARKKSR